MIEKRFFVSCCLVAGIVGWAGLRMQVRADANSSNQQPAENPHWSAEGCASCHAVGDGEFSTIPVNEIDGLCLGCHDGVRASEELHPIGRSFDSPQITLPKDWPAPEGRLGCITCHNVRQACQPQPVRPALNSVFLRSEPTANAYCNQCHTAAADHGQLNPHRMLDADGQVNKQTCTFCHQSEMPTGPSARRTGDSRLQMDPILLCLRCHQSHTDYFEPGHIGIKPSSQILERISKLNQAQSLEHPEAHAAVRSKYASLPLSPEGRVTCSTCHNPHQQGVFPEGSVLGCGARRLDRADGGLPHRGLDRDLCGACHAK